MFKYVCVYLRDVNDYFVALILLKNSLSKKRSEGQFSLQIFFFLRKLKKEWNKIFFSKSRLHNNVIRVVTNQLTKPQTTFQTSERQRFYIVSSADEPNTTFNRRGLLLSVCLSLSLSEAEWYWCVGAHNSEKGMFQTKTKRNDDVQRVDFDRFTAFDFTWWINTFSIFTISQRCGRNP